ncbi:Major facilitator transporter [Burkholderia gladioli]|uniref:Major facilitator transporter n=1 Tax=Burkholderia gladioli (strain BSR3) TaxID=999541 RepID=F2LIS3_BURGS|nr:MFS transporter [Burkholderia gladioli]AEA63049.1 major facilitator transporter [Burkholderia gladioli BSR3]MBW5285802.1 MFS transporter [Burkholderia gladioli]NHH78233.1 Inner membrane metabolite transport protein YhjE [Burkholderia gladioli]CAG9191256.1 Major facilitator transporter [Burkholderia gladioli]
MHTQTPVRQPRRAALASFVGTTIEWYDFYSYATAAAIVFGPLFFPGESRLVSLLASFGSFAVGFFARPLGGLLFGYLGDRYGRKRSLLATLLLMAVATVAIGLLPTYAQAGALAPVLLVLMRVLQGVAVGGEWGGAVLLAGEHAPKGKRTFFASFAQLGSASGLILSMVAFGAISTLPKEDLMSWGWRLPFLASAVLLVVGFAIRASVSESPEFVEVKASGEMAANPVREALRQWPLLLLAIGANVYGIAGVYFSNIFMISYATQFLSLDRSMVLHCMTIVAGLQFVVQLGAAWVAQRFGTHRVLLATAAWAAVVPFIMLPLVHAGTPLSITLGIGLATLAESGYYAVVAGFVSGMFAARIRYTAISISYQVCGALAGGLTPLVATVIAQNSAPQWWPLALQYTAAALLSGFCVLKIVRRGDAGRLDRGLHEHAGKGELRAATAAAR